MNSGRDISVVIQGPVHGSPSDPPALQITRRAVDSVRRVWPSAEVILSTWRGANTAGLECDQVIENVDPGGISTEDPNPRKPVNNLNRQLVSTRHGLERATRQFAIKLRSDCELARAVDFTLLDRGERNPEWSVFEKRVITLNVYTRHPLRRPVLFHLSDLFQAGLTTDLRAIWSAPLVSDAGFTRAVDPSQPPLVNAYPGEKYFFRCSSEQYLVEQLLKTKFPQVAFRHQSDGSVELLFLWLRILANNFCLLTPAEAGLVTPERMAGHERHRDLFVPTDRAWLDLWTRTKLPPLVEFTTAIRYQALRFLFAVLSRVPPRLFGGRLP